MSTASSSETRAEVPTTSTSAKSDSQLIETQESSLEESIAANAAAKRSKFGKEVHLGKLLTDRRFRAAAVISSDGLTPEQEEQIRFIVDSVFEAYADECLHDKGACAAREMQRLLDIGIVVGSKRYERRAYWSVMIGSNFVGSTSHLARCHLRCGIMFILVTCA